MEMLQGAFGDGDTIRVEAAGDELAFVRPADPPADPAQAGTPTGPGNVSAPGPRRH